ncbi:conserved hypothetical protein [Verticillium alfalfae VaMs.102]|uniref:BZIP domain-containing protein n=1 Tax=Verticillium alfalfae (strain VaMs.102 / ATCC MYA-4576 / FGSC 10136) TaxID=526221 RepID=C9SE77_VERA1|nr:conserved hypothetical protein [Verticillium alfalfae VaMs.102]EEY16486.1 conserved hypothetical protein [Verticillium alfalfae VaMs.102]
MSQGGRPSFQPSRLSLSPQSQAASHERVAAIRDDGHDHTSSDYSHGPGPTPEDRSRPQSARSLGISQSHATQEPGTPASQAGLTPSGNTPTERHSPANAFPFPAMNRPRHLLSPQPSGLGGMGAAGIHQTQPGDHQVPFQHAEATTRRQFRGDRDSGAHHTSSIPGLPFTGPHPSLSKPQTASLTPPRSLSQPSLGHLPQPSSQSRHPFSTLPQEAHERTHEPQTQPSHPFGLPPRTYSTSIPPGSPVWPGPGQGTPLYNSIRSSAAAGGSDGQAMLRMSLGGDGGSVDVVLDNRQASRQADEKRQRNAGASARFRKRKKDQIGALESENVDLKSQMQVLMQEREWFRAERDRLRNLLLQTPLAEHAAGPNSPVIVAESAYGSEANLSNQTGSAAQALQGYGSGDSSGERPARRRRTSATPTFTTPTYGTPNSTPTSLPPINTPMYSGMANSPSMRPGERLPPLRAR